MPHTLKRRADAISREEESPPASEYDSSSSSQAPQRRRQTQKSAPTQSQRRRHQSTPPSDVSGSDNDRPQRTDTEAQKKIYVKKLVRYALSCEYARQPIRRSDINEKILKDESGKKVGPTLNVVFGGAQTVLRDVFGMEMVELPGRERTELKDRRKAAQKATQQQQQQQGTQGGGGRKGAAQMEVNGEGAESQGRKRGQEGLSGVQNWILLSTLPLEYRQHEELSVPGRAPDSDAEATYAALCGMIVSLLYLHTPSGVSGGGRETQGQSQGAAEDSTEPLSDARLMRYLGRLGLRESVPTGPEGYMTTDKLLSRMQKEGYIDKRKDNSSGEELIEWVVGPRAKREIGRQGAARLVRGVYGFGIDGKGRGLPMPAVDEEEGNEGEENEQRTRPVKMEKAELERRLKRTLGDVVSLNVDDERTLNGVGEELEDVRLEDSGRREPQSRGGGEKSRTTRRSARRRNNDDDDDDDG